MNLPAKWLGIPPAVAVLILAAVALARDTPSYPDTELVEGRACAPGSSGNCLTCLTTSTAYGCLSSFEGTPWTPGFCDTEVDIVPGSGCLRTRLNCGARLHCQTGDQNGHCPELDYCKDHDGNPSGEG